MKYVLIWHTKAWQRGWEACVRWVPELGCAPSSLISEPMLFSTVGAKCLINTVPGTEQARSLRQSSMHAYLKMKVRHGDAEHKGEVKPSSHRWMGPCPVCPAPLTPLRQAVPTFTLREPHVWSALLGWTQAILRLLWKRLHSSCFKMQNFRHVPRGMKVKESLCISVYRKWDFVNISDSFYLSFAQLISFHLRVSSHSKKPNVWSPGTPFLKNVLTPLFLVLKLGKSRETVE